MSDDLLKRLRGAYKETDPEGETYTVRYNPDGPEAADRIDKLEANVMKASNAAFLEKRRAEDAEAKLNKAIDALEKVQAFVRDLEPHADQGHTLVPALREACETLAELKQGA
jgi:hypothetical protein